MLEARLVELGSVAVAFSGGVDSSYLLAVAVDVLGPQKALALTADTALVPRHELSRAREVASQIGAQHIVVKLDPLQEPGVAANPPERCYYCKRAVFTALRCEARRRGVEYLLHGANIDDQGDYRPGQRAADELGVLAPLVEVGLTKQAIRELSRQRGLTTWDLPTQACLATRVPYGIPLDQEALDRIERAEDYLRERFGFRALRVRHHGSMARLELPEGDWPTILEPLARAELLATLAQLGFKVVSLDLAGLQSGSMNRLIEQTDAQEE